MAKSTKMAIMSKYGQILTFGRKVVESFQTHENVRIELIKKNWKVVYHELHSVMELWKEIRNDIFYYFR